MQKLLIIVILLIIPFNTFAVEVTSKSAVVMDMDSKRIFYEKNIHEPRLIASITKIMTAVIAIERGDLSDIVTVGEEVLTMYGSNIYLELNEKMSLENLLYGLLLRSGNDAAIVIAKYIGGTVENFVKLMNEKAQKLGMYNTIYHNPHGLDEETQNYSTAYDMALLSSYANTLEVYKKISSTKKHIVQSTTKSYLWYNRNKLLTNYTYATGGKTGYTPKAGRTLVTTSTKDNLNLTAVTLYDNNEYQSHINMYEYVFDNYKNYLIIDQNNFSLPKEYFNDEIYINTSYSYPLSIKETNNIKTLVKLNKITNYKDNDIIGSVSIILNNQKLSEQDIYVKLNQEKMSFFDKIKKIFAKLFK